MDIDETTEWLEALDASWIKLPKLRVVERVLPAQKRTRLILLFSIKNLRVYVFLDIGPRKGITAGWAVVDPNKPIYADRLVALEEAVGLGDIACIIDLVGLKMMIKRDKLDPIEACRNALSKSANDARKETPDLIRAVD